jgi:hypothetical protein
MMPLLRVASNIKSTTSLGTRALKLFIFYVFASGLANGFCLIDDDTTEWFGSECHYFVLKLVPAVHGQSFRSPSS